MAKLSDLSSEDRKTLLNSLLEEMVHTGAQARGARAISAVSDASPAAGEPTPEWNINFGCNSQIE